LSVRQTLFIACLHLALLDAQLAWGDSPAPPATLQTGPSHPAPKVNEPWNTARRIPVEELPGPQQQTTMLPSVGGTARLPRLPPPEDAPFTGSRAFVQPLPNMMRNLPDTAKILPNGKQPETVGQPTLTLSLETVLRSVEQDYPLLAAAFQERGIAAGDLLAADGPFDTRLVSGGKSVPLGYYQYTTADTYLERANRNGGRSFAGYRIGTGPTFPIWYGELETNTGGEFRAGHTQSLLQGLVIDKRRADLIKAQIARTIAEPVIVEQRIDFLRAAAVAYWEWLGAGRKYVIAQQVLNEASERNKILSERVRRGDAAEIEQVDNQRIVVDREAKLIAAGRKFQETAIKLSLFYRDEAGLPLLPDPRQLPHFFPMPRAPNPNQLTSDLQLAYQRRPELRELSLKRQSLNVERNLARNQTLPQLDGFITAAKDVGSETPPIDKTPFQLETGLVGSVPLQRSAARGNMRAAEASIRQVSAKLQWYEDKITAEVQDSVSAILAAHGQLRPRREAVQLTHRMEIAERRKYALGDSNLFVLNLRELDTRDAASLEVDAIVAYFVSTAFYHAALGLDGLRILELQTNRN